MRVAMIGLGDIAEKAYLPTLGRRTDIELVLVTRNQANLERLASQYRVSRAQTGLAAAIAGGLDAAFVHAATEAHAGIVGELLAHRVPVFVDKPLAYELEESRRLVELAVDRGVSLIVGFNRRHAPAYRELMSWPSRDVVILQKHRVGLPDDVRRVILDDFIHVVDTLRWLGPQVTLADVTAVPAAAGLASVAVHLSDGQRLAVGVMNRMAGLTEEVLEVTAEGRRRRVVNVAEVTDYLGAECTTRRDEWTPVAVQRGFEQACDAFLADVSAGRVTSAEDALATHVMCEQIVQEIEARI